MCIYSIAIFFCIFFIKWHSKSLSWSRFSNFINLGISVGIVLLKPSLWREGSQHLWSQLFSFCLMTFLFTSVVSTALSFPETLLMIFSIIYIKKNLRKYVSVKYIRKFRVQNSKVLGMSVLAEKLPYIVLNR